MHPLIEKGRIFATAAHAAVGQVRKYTGDPYIVHPAAVVEILGQYTSDPELLCAGWLHDVPEDTDVSLALIEREFTPRVAALVEMATNPKKQPGWNRAMHQEAILRHAAESDPQGKNLKLADVWHNCRSIAERAPEFARVYLPEKMRLIEVLKDGNPLLWKAVHDELLGQIKKLDELFEVNASHEELEALHPFDITPAQLERQ